MNSKTIAEDTRNKGFFRRRRLMTQSREFDMIGRLHEDIFPQERYTLSEDGVKIKLVPSKDEFCLMGTVKAKILHASLFVRKVKLMPSDTYETAQ